MVCISTAHCSQGSVFQINQSEYLCAAACQLLSCHPHMLWNSRTRSRVLALGNARGVARSSCRLPKLWDHVVSHSIKAGSSLPLFLAQLASQCSLDFPLLWYGTVSCGHACITNESASTCTRTRNIASEIANTWISFVCYACATPRTWVSLLSGASRTSGVAPCEVSRFI